MRIFYFVADDFPAWRVDLVELFSVQLRGLGVDTTWHTRRKQAGWMCRSTMHGQTTFLPMSLGKSSAVGKVLNRLLEPLSELFVFLRLLFGQRHDVIQVRDNRYTAALFALVAAKIRRSKFTYWLSFPFPQNDLAMAREATGARRLFLLARGKLAFVWLYRIILPMADHVFVQSQKMKDNMIALGLPAERMEPVPMGIPPRLLEFAESSPPEIVAGRVLYLGTLAASRRLETLIEAFAIVRQRHPEAMLFMVGEGDVPQERTRLEQLAADLGLADAIRFTGFVPMENAWQLVMTSEVCISPIYPSETLDVGSPTKLIEYMALAKPTVANQHPEQTIIVNECCSGKLVSWDSRDFAEGITWLLDNRVEARQMAERGLDWVRRHRTYDRIAANVHEQLVRLCGRSQAARKPHVITPYGEN